MKTWFSVLTLFLAGAAAAATVWTWVDENGQQHFSDRPVEGARQLEVQGAQGFSRSLRAQPARAMQPQPASTPYTRFTVVSPSQQETLWNIGGNLNVQVDLTPPLQAGHRIDAYLDGQLVPLAARSSQFTIPEVFRGLHTLQAVVMDGNDREVVRSLAVTFMVQQTSILNPNNPNNRSNPNN
ncbi:MAG: DUF4124 domain-containing protein [Gammaproteobacteria bacterium]|nr:DUF4124 domain-containing protein [Gammaproteobacteria bacterium]